MKVALHACCGPCASACVPRLRADGHEVTLLFANSNIDTAEEFERRRAQYAFARPFTKESLLYREIFEKYYPGQAEMVKDFWMPNRSWEGCDVSDPSARVLANYGASGE